MKRYFSFVILVVISLYISYPSSLQGYTYSGQDGNVVSLRLFAGFDLAKFRYHWGDPEAAADEALMEPYRKHHLGVCAGFGMETRGRVGVMLEILYNQKGERLDFEDVDDIIKSTIVIHEMSIPILLKLNLNKNRGPYILAGGEFAFVLSAIESHEVYYDMGINGHDVSYDKGSENITDRLKRLNCGIVVGAGLKFVRGHMGFFLEVRYHYGLTDLAKNEIKSHPDDRMRTNAIVFMIGISTL
jgi:hypothetical protein